MRMSERRKTILLTLLILAPVGVILFLWAACSPPSDKVDVQFVSLPREYDFLCLVADTPTGPEPMDWYTVVLGSWSTHHPNGKAWAKLSPGAPAFSAGPDFVPVRWKTGTQYGVVTYTRATGWKGSWFRPDEVPVQRTVTLGGRHATFDLTGREPEPLAPALVDRLGLATVPDELTDKPSP